MLRLNKFLAHAGLGSRRHCDDLIASGRIRVDGLVVREMGARVDPETANVELDGQPVRPERHVYWLVNKPLGYLCTNHDPDGRPRAIDLVPHVGERVYTVGRLDEDSEGLILLTNDGDLAFKLMHPRFGIHKTYLVQVAGKPTKEDLEKLLEGVWLSDGHVKAKRVKRLKSQGESTWLEIVLTEGKNREIRRMLAKLDHKVMRLKRIALGPIKLDRLRKGKARKLKIEEVELLNKHANRPHRNEQPEKPEFEDEARPALRARKLPRPTAGAGDKKPTGPNARPVRPRRPERGERAERGERPDRPQRSEQGPRPERGERRDRPERPDRSERPRREDRPGNRPPRRRTP
jgi:23S rRNA pseudouridine2605 synthase